MFSALEVLTTMRCINLHLTFDNSVELGGAERMDDVIEFVSERVK